MGKPDYILLIDDDQMANYLNMTMLEMADAAEEIFVVENGKDAFSIISQIENKAKSKEIKLCILLDLDMPLFDGYEFLDALQADRRNLKVQIYILSVLLESKEKEHFTKYPIERFIEKPLKDRDVKDILSKNEPVYFNQAWEIGLH